MTINPNDGAAPLIVPASPEFHQHNFVGYGLSKREMFAAMAVQGIMANTDLATNDADTIAAWGVEQADALIAALNEDPI